MRRSVCRSRDDIRNSPDGSRIKRARARRKWLSGHIPEVGFNPQVAARFRILGKCPFKPDHFEKRRCHLPKVQNIRLETNGLARFDVVQDSKLSNIQKSFDVSFSFKERAIRRPKKLTESKTCARLARWLAQEIVYRFSVHQHLCRIKRTYPDLVVRVFLIEFRDCE
jgi:hypothetical protein